MVSGNNITHNLNMFSMMRLFFALSFIPLILCVNESVPGCPDVDILESATNIDQETLNNLLLCFCKVGEQKNVVISCLYGSTPMHLQRATDAVKNTSFTIQKISIQHMEFAETQLPHLGKMAPSLENIEIRDCGTRESLNIPEQAFEGLEQTLRNITIHGCSLTNIPASIAKLEALEIIDLSSNKIENVPASIFAEKNQVKYIDLSANNIDHIEEDAFIGLNHLHTIVFGERNYVNESVLEEIAKIPAIKILDLSRADGIFEPPTSIFDKLQNLEELKLSGCSIENLEAGAFANLVNLKQLDLRVNLIENISAYAFDGLEKLERLTLAGNYIRKIDKDVWTGIENLKEIDLGWNEINELEDDALKPLQQLTDLNLRHNPLTRFKPNGLAKLQKLSLAECQLKTLESDDFQEYSELQELDISRCNISEIPADMFKAMKNLKILNMSKNGLKNMDSTIMNDLTALEEIKISGNPFLCDSNIKSLINNIKDRYKGAVKEGRNFLFANGNETLCDRPYALRGQPILELAVDKLQDYDESMDTTTIPSTTALADNSEDTTTPLTLPDLFIGSETNDTLFKEEPRRTVYDLEKYDDPRNGRLENDPNAKYLVPITIGVIGVITVIALIAVALFMKKKRSAVTPQSEKKGSVEDGMVNIELNSNVKDSR